MARQAITPEEARAIEARKQAQQDWAEVLRTPAGRRAVHYLLTEVCGVFDPVGFRLGDDVTDGRRLTDQWVARRDVGLELILIGGIRLDGLRDFQENRHEHEGQPRPNRARQVAKGRRGEGPGGES